MTDTTTSNQPYTLESANFQNTVSSMVTKAKNDIATIDDDVSKLMAQFKADISSRQARKADLQLIVAHGESLMANITHDLQNVGEKITDAIGAAMSTAADEVGAEIQKLRIAQQTAPQPPATPAGNGIEVEPPVTS